MIREEDGACFGRVPSILSLAISGRRGVIEMRCSSEDSVQVYFRLVKVVTWLGLTAFRDRSVRGYGYLGLRVLATYVPDYGIWNE